MTCQVMIGRPMLLTGYYDQEWECRVVAGSGTVSRFKETLTFCSFNLRGARMNAVRQNALRDTVEIIKAHGSNPNFNYSRIAKNIRETYEELVKLYGEADE